MIGSPDHSESRHPFTADSDPLFFRLLREAWGNEDAFHAFELAVAPYIHHGHIGIPRISVQLFSDDDREALDSMQIQGEEVPVWPFRIAAASPTESSGVWEHGEAHFLQDDALWRAVKGVNLNCNFFLFSQLHTYVSHIFETFFT